MCLNLLIFLAPACYIINVMRLFIFFILAFVFSFFSLNTLLSLPWLSPFFPPLFPSACCLFPAWILSLGPMIQVHLSCLLHSTQSTYTSSIRLRASLFCRYSTRAQNKLVWLGVSGSGVKYFVLSCLPGSCSLKFVQSSWEWKWRIRFICRFC